MSSIINDVFEHHGITGTFTLSAFSQNMERTLKIYCEKGEIYGSSDKKKVKYTFFGDPEEKSVDVVYKNEIYASHGGGDMQIPPPQIPYNGFATKDGYPFSSVFYRNFQQNR